MEATYQALTMELATLLGWSNFHIDTGMMQGIYATPPEAVRKEYGMSESQRTRMPVWIMDSGAVFDLMAEHDVMLAGLDAFALCTMGDHAGEWSYIDFREPVITYHPTKVMAYRYATVKLLINKLKGN